MSSITHQQSISETNTFFSVKEYIWHCPNEECKKKGIILFKTNEPYLGSGRIKCQACGQEYSFYNIMQENKRNLERFFKRVA